jgi:hypothetical protein
MRKRWILPGAALVAAASLSVWGQATAGPPTTGSAGVVVQPAASAPATQSSSAPSTSSPTPAPTDVPASTAAPAPEAAEATEAAEVAEAPQQEVEVPARVRTFPPDEPFDDKGGLRNDNEIGSGSSGGDSSEDTVDETFDDKGRPKDSDNDSSGDD